MNRKIGKRTLAMLLSAALLLPLIGCAASPAAPTASEQPAKTPTEAGTAAPSSVSLSELAAPVYPQAAPYPNFEDYVDDWDAYEAAYQRWLESRKDAPSLSGQAGFWQDATAQFLSGAGRDSRVYSPLNVYFALAMLAETTDGDSRAQVLSLLGVDTVETLREQAAAVWEASYRDDGVAKTLLGSSFWLRNDMPYEAQTLQNLATYYYASAFSGEMGSEPYNQKLRDWVNEHTGNRLTEQAGGLEMNINTVLALVTTLYFKAPWKDSFPESATKSDVFHAASGDRDCDYLHETAEYIYYQGEQFTAIGKPLTNAGTMWFLLPNEGVTPEALLHDTQAVAFLTGDNSGVSGKNALVNFSLPKFDVVSELSLIDGLKALGVTDVFDDARSDFTPLTTAVRDLYVSSADHAARVTVDEEGCEAAAFTVITVEAKGMHLSPEVIDFTLDRPFLFSLTTEEGLPLFTGVVNEP